MPAPPSACGCAPCPARCGPSSAAPPRSCWWGRRRIPSFEREHAAWTHQLVEYINSHEEVEFHLKERTFHICRAHAEARRVIATGRIAADFACPVGAAACPFAAAAALVPGQAIRLKPGTAARVAGVHDGCAALRS